MAQLRERGPNTFLISVYLGRDNKGKRTYYHQTVRCSPTLAKKKAQELEVKLKKGRKNSALSLEELLDLWLETIKDSVYIRTHEKYAWHVKRLKVVFKGLRLDKLTSFDLQKRLKTIEGLAGRTRKDLFTTARTILRQAKAWELTETDLSIGLCIPRLAYMDRRVLNGHELLALLEAAKEYKNHLVLRVTVVTGARVGEVLGIPWKSINFQQGTLRIVQAADTKNRTIKEPKTQTSLRTIKLDPETLTELQEHKTRSVNPSADALVFASDDGRPLHYRSVRNVMKRSLAKAGLEPVRIHDLRHSAGSILLDEGVPLTTVADVLGQRPGTTAKIYAHAIRSGEGIGRYLDVEADKLSNKPSLETLETLV